MGLNGFSLAESTSGPTTNSSASVNGEYPFTSVLSGMTIDHNLGKYPNVVVLDSIGMEVVVDVVNVSRNRVILNWNGTLTGTAVIQ